MLEKSHHLVPRRRAHVRLIYSRTENRVRWIRDYIGWSQQRVFELTILRSPLRTAKSSLLYKARHHRGIHVRHCQLTAPRQKRQRLKQRNSCRYLNLDWISVINLETRAFAHSHNPRRDRCTA